MLLPPEEGVCPICATAHGPDQPHNQQSLYYQYRFYGVRKRWPTWADAVAHCSQFIKDQWTITLKTMGHWSEPDGEPIADPPGESFRQAIDGISDVTTHQLEQPQ